MEEHIGGLLLRQHHHHQHPARQRALVTTTTTASFDHRRVSRRDRRSLGGLEYKQSKGNHDDDGRVRMDRI